MGNEFSDRRFFSLVEVATMLKMAPGTVRNRLSRGLSMPPSILVGRRRLFPVDGLNQWIADLCNRSPIDRVQSSELASTRPSGQSLGTPGSSKQ